MKQKSLTGCNEPQWPEELDAYNAEQFIASVGDINTVRIVDEATKIIIGDMVPAEKVKLLAYLLLKDSGKTAKTSV